MCSSGTSTSGRTSGSCDAAGPGIPDPLRQQLAEDGGRLVMPVGTRVHQELTVVERRGAEFIRSGRDPVVFVPLIGEHGFGE